MHDKRLAERKMGTVRSLTALTKALTAYACLQLATRKRYTDAKQPTVYVRRNSLQSRTLRSC